MRTILFAQEIWLSLASFALLLTVRNFATQNVCVLSALPFAELDHAHCNEYFIFSQPSPIKKERSPRPQSFCHSSSISPQDKMAIPGLGTPRDKQRLSYGAFPNQIFVSVSTESTSPTAADAPPLPPRNAGKGMLGWIPLCVFALTCHNSFFPSLLQTTKKLLSPKVFLESKLT